MVIALLVSARSHTKLLSFLLLFAATISVAVQMGVTSTADCSPDELTIRNIISEEVAAWNSSDATAYSRHFAPKGTFTNIYGIVFEGHDAFEKRKPRAKTAVKPTREEDTALEQQKQDHFTRLLIAEAVRQLK